MGLLQRLLSGLLGGGRSGEEDGGALWLYVKCGQCGETIRVRVDKSRDLEELYEGESDFPTGYALHKEVIGQRCFRLMRVEMQLDQQKRPVEQRVEGGTAITRAEYEAAAGSQSAVSTEGSSDASTRQ